MPSPEKVTVRVADQIAAIDASLWDHCACPIATREGGRPDNPFLTHRFLLALEESGSAVPATGWGACHFIAETEQGAPLGLLPAYLKSHSRGEFVFDYGWADAFERAGGAYYPKLQAGVPFTPATGRRFLAHPECGLASQDVAEILLQGASQFAETRGISSLHVTFCTQSEWEGMGAVGMLQRQDQQFHWVDQGYGDFEGFLESLASRKRKQLKKERAKAVEAGVEIVRLTGDDIKPEHWDAFWTFYQDTGARKWGSPYLTRPCFEMLHDHMRQDILLVMCRRDGEWIAGALNFIGRETLFGRYWGCVEDHPYLHFEACYYQAIDAALELGVPRVEGGAQGAHKLARGYMPSPTYSLHWIAHPGLRHAVAQFLRQEREMVDAEIEALTEMGPYRKGAQSGE
ncbi:MAG: GNAT family N-acetyltransferase [Neomegalonema sp.]|nr:GNAT family N-acetyltransferase [Neomegalonema sp.]